MTDPRDDARLPAVWHGRHDAAVYATLCHRHSGLVETVYRRHHSPDPAKVVDDASLCGWLPGITRRVVLNRLRTVAVRRRHEQEASMEQDWQQAAAVDPLRAEALPHLDAALDILNTGCRKAVMRFCGNACLRDLPRQFIWNRHEAEN